MGRSKEMGKLVAELTHEELGRERERCRRQIASYGNRSPAGKSLVKRLYEIEKRMTRESPEQ